MKHFPTQLDEIDQWLVDNFGIMPGACSSTENLRHNIARMVAEALWPKDKTIQQDTDYVDLGLPSGLKWASCNVGATAPEEYGDYFSWSDPEDDVAHVKLGGKWRMPTDEEWTELRTKCASKWTTRNGINGRLVTGSNGNSIFLPAAGYRNNTNLFYTGSYGFYWSSSRDTDDPSSAWFVDFNSGHVYRNNGYRDYEQSVRAVLK